MQEHLTPPIPHKDYLPDVTAIEDEYGPEDDADSPDNDDQEYEDYQDNLPQAD